MAKSRYDRLKEWRHRQATGEEMPKCKMCDRPIKGKLSVERGICSYCYPKTKEGRKSCQENMKRYYAKQQKTEGQLPQE